MPFDLTAYGPAVADILALEPKRLMPLRITPCSSDEAAQRIAASKQSLFQNSVNPAAAETGLWLYFSCWAEAHDRAQADESAEGSFWHAIVHRQERDSSNSGYWFRLVGKHATFPAIGAAAREIVERYPSTSLHWSGDWDPLAFVEYCINASVDSAAEQVAREVQRAEWEILFDYCARTS